MEFSELLIKRRSIRGFQDKEVSRDIVMEIIKESCLAPSSGNGQPWRFIVINDRGMIKKLSDESKANLLSEIEANPESPSKKYKAVLGSEAYNVFYNAPCLVIIIGPKQLRSTLVDCSLVASYFMLSATAKGLGTCWVNLGSDIRDPKLLDEIGMPDDHIIVAPMILGYPSAIPNIPPRKDPEILKEVN